MSIYILGPDQDGNCCTCAERVNVCDTCASISCGADSVFTQTKGCAFDPFCTPIIYPITPAYTSQTVNCLDTCECPPPLHNEPLEVIGIARLFLYNLTIGTNYMATMYFCRADSPTHTSSVSWSFTATSTSEYTPYTDIPNPDFCEVGFRPCDCNIVAT